MPQCRYTTPDGSATYDLKPLAHTTDMYGPIYSKGRHTHANAGVHDRPRRG